MFRLLFLVADPINNQVVLLNLVNQDMEQVHLWVLPMPKLYPEAPMLDPQDHLMQVGHLVSNLDHKALSNSSNLA